MATVNSLKMVARQMRAPSSHILSRPCPVNLSHVSQLVKFTTRQQWFHASRCLFQEHKQQPQASEDETTEGDLQPESPELKEVKQQLKEAHEKIADLDKEKDKILRVAADLQNHQRTLQRDIAKCKEYGIQKFAENLLTVADNLQMTIEKEKKVLEEPESSAAKLYEAVLLTEKTLLQVFAKHEIERFQSLGKPFDPTYHDGQFEIDHDVHPPGSVGAVVSDGYKLKDRIIRPAKVGTVRKKS
eukprot:gb/GEZN01013288.1/.p1 GENE.gb/GEZN01013288.1/~~gb/GEZN01013288.1/.p1  ORF type:complete len:253 (-),score=48.29 gb/GEZN01013288.1/:265-993(-)